MSFPRTRASSNASIARSTPGLTGARTTSTTLSSLDSPEESLAVFWGKGEGSVTSSTSSADSKERLILPRRRAKLERPFVGRPRESRERCMSVSLVVGPDGMAQVRREEVEVEFLESQDDLGGPEAGSLMERMVSSAGSDVSVSRTFKNMSLVSSTRGEVLVRSASQQTDLSRSMPPTPLTDQFPQFVSPKYLKNEPAAMTRSWSLLRSPESAYWSGTGEDSDFEVDSELTSGDAQTEVRRLFDRKQGTVAAGFVGSSMPLSPMAPARTSSQTICSACSIVFKSKVALASHTTRCSVKQTPFVSTDFFGSLEMFQMSEDALLMSSFSNAAETDGLSSIPLGSLLRSDMDRRDDLSLSMSPRKKRRNDRLSPSPIPLLRTREALPSSRSCNASGRRLSEDDPRGRYVHTAAQTGPPTL